MRIHQVTLKNIGPHKDFTANFNSGLIGIVGANGSGKSTLVNSIYAALTNDYSRSSGVKSDLISSGTEGNSFIEIYGEHLGQSFKLVRSLRPNKSEFQIGGRVYETTSAVNEAVLSELNISKSILDNYVFVNQWQMFSFLNETAAERAKTFQILCNTEICSKIHKVCNDYVIRRSELEVVDNSNELHIAIADAEARENEAKKLIDHYLVLTPSEEELEKTNSILEQHRNAKKASESLSDLEASIASAKSDFDKASNTLITTESKITDYEAWFNDNQTTLSDALSWQKYSKLFFGYQQQLQELQASLDSVESRRKKLAEAKPRENNYIEPQQRTSAKDQQNQLKSFMEFTQAIDLGCTTCKYCLQDISESQRKTIETLVQDNSTNLKKITAALDYSEAYDKEQESRKQQLQNLDESEASLLKQVKQLTKLKDELAFDPTAADAAAKLLKYAASQKQSLQNLKASLSGLRSNLESLKQKKTELEIAYNNCFALVKQAPAQTEVDKAVVASENFNNALLGKAKATGAYAEAKKTKEQYVQLLLQLNTKLAKYSKLKKLLETVSEVGELFHWNQLPSLVSQSNFNLLIADINDNLKFFNNPFVVEADADLTFKVHLPGKLPVSAKQLSGGQQVILAIAFRAALDRVFGKDTGILVLDEPTAGLDVDNLQYFHLALQELSSRLGQDRQLIVITHEQNLNSVFDQLIEV